MWNETEEKGGAVNLTKCCVPPKRITSFVTKRPAVKFIAGLSRPEVEIYQKHISSLKNDLERLSRTPFSYKRILDRNAIFDVLTGMPKLDDFLFLHQMIATSVFESRSRTDHGIRDHTFLALMRLRLNMTEKDLSVKFDLAESLVWSTMERQLGALYSDIFQLTVQRFELEQTIKVKSFPIRMIIDIVEVCVAVDDSVRRDQMIQRNLPYKAVLGIRANGQVCFASQLYSVFIPNEDILRHCSVSYYFKAGDTVIINPAHEAALRRATAYLKDFNINCSGNQTAFKDVLDVVLPKLERRIEEIKKYQILSAIPPEWVHCGSAIWQVCAALSNFKPI